MTGNLRLALLLSCLVFFAIPELLPKRLAPASKCLYTRQDKIGCYITSSSSANLEFSWRNRLCKTSMKTKIDMHLNWVNIWEFLLTNHLTDIFSKLSMHIKLMSLTKAPDFYFKWKCLPNLRTIVKKMLLGGTSITKYSSHNLYFDNSILAY